MTPRSSSVQETFKQVVAALGDRVGNDAPASPMDEWQLCTRGVLTEADLLNAYAAACGLPVLSDSELETVVALPDVAEPFLLANLCLPISEDAGHCRLVVADPYHRDELYATWLHLCGQRADFALARRSVIERQIQHLYGDADSQTTEDENALRDLAQEAPIIRLVNTMFARAVELNASDIHVEPKEDALDIRFRVDGRLVKGMSPSKRDFPAICSRLKLLGGLNIAEHRLPQDGRTEVPLAGKLLDVRISTLPSIHGESIVLRLLSRNSQAFRLAGIGIEGKTMADFQSCMQQPHGILLVVGPTGSGKTTTLYCALNELNADDKKIITIEDPVEYQIPQTTQIQVRPSIGLTFANGLRHIVRQDPDIVLVGEIRDRETAEIAIHAALTGHLVLSTLHTNSAAGAVARLLDMGIEAYLLASALNGVLSQRLVRCVCSACKGEGCDDCNCTGRKGRTGIFEFLPVTDAVRHAIRDEVDAASIEQIAVSEGMGTIDEDARHKVDQGVTALDEVPSFRQD